MAVFFLGRVEMVDNHNLKATKQFEIEVNTTIHATKALQVMAAYAELAQLAGKLDDITDLQVVNATLTVSVMDDVTGLKSAPGDQGAAEGAIITLFTKGSDYDSKHAYWIPGATEGIFLSDYRTVDITDAALQDFFEEFDDPIGDLGVRVNVSDGEVIDVDEGQNGLLSGYYATKQRSAK